jgi:starch synthase (maltosyl-transferring)
MAILITPAEHYANLEVEVSELWRVLIQSAKSHHPGMTFFAESLGCPLEDTVRLAQSGFDFMF